jgi:hypothetical protein
LSSSGLDGQKRTGVISASKLGSLLRSCLREGSLNGKTTGIMRSKSPRLKELRLPLTQAVDMPIEGKGKSMFEPILIGLSAVLWGLLWGYATLLVVLVNFKEQGSVYAYPMQAVLDRFVESLGLDWLKALHAMQLRPLRRISYALFGAVTLGVAFMLWVLG